MIVKSKYDITLYNYRQQTDELEAIQRTRELTPEEDTIYKACLLMEKLVYDDNNWYCGDDD